MDNLAHKFIKRRTAKAATTKETISHIFRSLYKKFAPSICFEPSRKLRLLFYLDISLVYRIPEREYDPCMTTIGVNPTILTPRH